MSLKIGVIVHGPTIIDKGYAKKIINLLSNYGVVSARLGGTMGRTAVIDASLENVINIEDKLLPRGCGSRKRTLLSGVCCYRCKFRECY